MLSKSFQITNQYGTPFYKISGNGDSLAGIANFLGFFFWHTTIPFDFPPGKSNIFG